MSRPVSSSAALPIAYLVLRILIVVNWLMAPVVLALLFVIPNEQWILSAFDLSPSLDAERLVMGLRAIAALGLAAIPLESCRPQTSARDRRDGARGRPVRRRKRAPFAGDRLDVARVAATQHRRRDDCADPFRHRRIRSISMPASRSMAGSPCSSRSCWLACSRKARSCAKTSTGRCEMAIAVKLDDLLHDRRMTLTELADRIGLTLANLSILKTGKARAIRFSTLEAICEALSCQPGDILRFEPKHAQRPRPATAGKRSTSR